MIVNLLPMRRPFIAFLIIELQQCTVIEKNFVKLQILKIKGYKTVNLIKNFHIFNPSVRNYGNIAFLE